MTMPEDMCCGILDALRNMLLALKLLLDNGKSTGAPVIFEEVLLLLYTRLVLLSTTLLPPAVLLLLLDVMFRSCKITITTFTLISDLDRTDRAGGSANTAIRRGVDGDTADKDSFEFETDKVVRACRCWTCHFIG